MQSDSPQSNEDEEIVVQAIIRPDGTRGEPLQALAQTDTLGVSQYAGSESESESDSSSSEGQEPSREKKELSNGTVGAARKHEESNGTRKRVRFADQVQPDHSGGKAVKKLRVDANERDHSGEAELDADMARFKAILESTRTNEEADLDLAEAEDAEEEALQEEWKAKVNGMRERLNRHRKGKSGAQSADTSSRRGAINRPVNDSTLLSFDEAVN